MRIDNITDETYDDNPSAGDYDYSVAAVNAAGTGPFSRLFTIREFGTTQGAIELTAASSQYLSHANHADFNTATSWTASTWFKAKSGHVDGDIWGCLAKVDFFGAGSDIGWIVGRINAVGRLYWRVVDAAGGDHNSGLSLDILAVGTWYYLEIKWNVATESLSIKVNDGAFYSSNTSIAAGLANNTNAFRLGYTQNGPVAYTNGYFGATRFWNRCLTDAESTTMYNHDGFGRATPLSFADIPAEILTGLAASWDWQVGALVEDSTASNHDLTNNGTATIAKWPE